MNACVTLEEARLFAGGVLDGMEDDTLLALTKLYTGLAEEYCRTKFLPTRATFQTDAVKRIPLPLGPLLAVEKVCCVGKPLRENDEYNIYPELGLLQLADPEGGRQKKRSLTIDYIYGYEAVPALVKKVITDLMRLDRIGSRGDPTLLSENFDGEYSYQKNGAKTAEDMQKDTLALLDAFVQPAYTAPLQETGNVRARWI